MYRRETSRNLLGENRKARLDFFSVTNKRPVRLFETLA